MDSAVLVGSLVLFHLSQRTLLFPVHWFQYSVMPSLTTLIAKLFSSFGIEHISWVPTELGVGHVAKAKARSVPLRGTPFSVDDSER